MLNGKRIMAGLAGVAVAVLLVTPAAAQVESQVSAYTGENAKGYLKPLSDAFGATLNSGFFRSAYLPTSGFNIGFEVIVMGLYFSDDDRTFRATTEGSFLPQQSVSVPTVIGPGEAVIISGDAGTSYAFPGGLSLNSFAMLAPQLRISSLYGTEFVGRYGRVNSGDAELGDVTLWGIGVRHNVSQYFGEDFVADIAVGIIYQDFSAGENSQGGDLTGKDLRGGVVQVAGGQVIGRILSCIRARRIGFGQSQGIADHSHAGGHLHPVEDKLAAVDHRLLGR